MAHESKSESPNIPALKGLASGGVQKSPCSIRLTAEAYAWRTLYIKHNVTTQTWKPQMKRGGHKGYNPLDGKRLHES